MKSSSLLRPMLFAALSGLGSLTSSAQWVPVSGLPAGFNSSDIAIAPDGTLFTCGTATDTAQSGLYRSSNGTSWARKNSGMSFSGQEQIPWRIGAFNEATLAATNGGDGIFRSLNAGDSWTSAGLGPAAAYWDFCRYDADTYFVTKRENVVGQSGVWRSLDRGATWTRKSTGIYGLTLPVVGEQIATEAVTLHNSKLFAAVSTTGVFRSTNAGESWTSVNNGLLVDFTPVGPLVNTTDVISTGTALFASHQAIDTIYRSENDGDSWTNIGAGLGSFSFRMAADGGTLYAPMHDGRLFVTSDGGRSWRYYAATGLPGGVQPFIAVKHNVAAYYTTSAGLYKLDLSTAPLLNVAPVITLQPVGGTRLVGTSYTFTVAANGTGPFTYRWRRNGITVEGVTADTLTLNPLTAGDAGPYDCVVTGPGGSVTSNAVALAIVLDTPGNVDTLFDTGVPGVNSTTAVNALHLSSAGRLWTGGNYTGRLLDAAAGSPVANRLTTYSGSPLRFSTDGGLNGTVNVLLPLANGQMLAGGAFTSAGSPATNTKYLARFNADGTFDNTFIAPATTGTGEVRALVQDPATSKIYVAGTFLDWGGDTARDSLIRLNADGTLDGTFSSAAMMTNPGLAALALAPDGKLYVGGSFFGVNIGGTANYNYANFIRLNTDGTVDATFPVGTQTVPHQVIALIMLPDGRFYAATRTGGRSVKQLQRFLPNVTPDPSFALPNEMGTITALALQPDGKLLAGGTTNDFAGLITPGKMVRLLNTGAIDSTITYQQPGTDTSREATAFAFAGNHMYVSQFRGGAEGVRRYFNNLVEPSFIVPPLSQSVNVGQPVTLKAYVYATQTVTYQWNKDGVAIPGATTDTLSFPALSTSDTASYTVTVTHPFGPVISPAAVVRALAAPQLGVGSTAVSQLGNTPVTLSPDVFGAAPLTFQWLKNGVPIVENTTTAGGGTFTGVATRTLNITGLHEGDNGIYTLRVTNSQGTLDVPISVTALFQAAYLANDFVAGGAGFEFATAAADDKFLIWQSGPDFTTWAGAPATGRILRLNSNNTRDTSFTAPVFTGGGPYGVRQLRSGKILVWGIFTTVAGLNHPSVVRLNSDGTVDPTFIANNRTALQAFSLTGATELPDGKLIFFGSFANWGAGPGFSGYPTLVCLNADGTVNVPYMSALGAVPAAGTIAAADVLADGRAVLSGGFTSIGGLARTNMAVLSATGAVATNWVPPTFTGGGPDRLFPLPDGRIMVSGQFNATSGGIGQVAGWAVLLPTGGRDTSVNVGGVGYFVRPVFGRDANGGILVANLPGGSFWRFTGNFVPDTNWLPPPVNSVDAIIGLPSGRIVLRHSGTYQGRNLNGLGVLRGHPVALGFTAQPQSQSVDLGGSVTLSAAATGTTPVSYQWLKDGVEIPGATSATLTISNATPADAVVYSLRISNFSGGTATSSGATLSIVAEPVFTSLPLSQTVRAGDSVTFAVMTTGVQPIAYQWLKGGVEIAGATSASLTLTGVALDAAASYTCRASNTVLGSPVSVLSPPVYLSVGGGSGGGINPAFAMAPISGSSSRIESLFLDPDDKLIISGNYAQSGVWHAGRYASNGTRESSFITNSAGGTGANCNGFVHKIARDPATGNYVGVGTFTNFGGALRSRIGRVTPSFVADTTFNPGTGFGAGTDFPLGNGAALAIDSSSRIYVGGDFTTYNGTTVSRLIRLNSDGTLDTTFTPPSFNGTVRTLLISGTKLYVGGSFTQVGGTNRPRLVRLNGDGTHDAGFVCAMATGTVYDVVELPDGDLFIAGTGSISTSTYVHRLNGNGSVDNAFRVFNTIGGEVRAIAPAPGGKLFIGGAFTTVFLNNVSQPRSRVALLNADGTLDSGWNPGTGISGGNQIVYDLVLSAAGTLYVGGSFTSYDSQARAYLAAVNAVGIPAQIATLSASGPATVDQPLTLGVAATGAAFPAAPYLTYQWIKDGTDIPGANGQTYTIASYAAADAGNYTVRVNGAGGNASSTALNVAAAANGFATWAAGLPAGERDPDDDFDADGISNLLEYAFDLNPLANSSGLLPPPNNTSTHLTITYRRARTDVTYVAITSPTLTGGTWSSAGVDQGTPDVNGVTTARIPLGPNAGFMRISVTLNP